DADEDPAREDGERDRHEHHPWPRERPERRGHPRGGVLETHAREREGKRGGVTRTGAAELDLGEGVADGEGRLGALRRLRREETPHEVLERRRDRRVVARLAERGDVVAELPREDLAELAVEEALSRDHLPEDHPERVEVGAEVDA